MGCAPPNVAVAAWHTRRVRGNPARAFGSVTAGGVPSAGMLGQMAGPAPPAAARYVMRTMYNACSGCARKRKSRMQARCPCIGAKLSHTAMRHPVVGGMVKNSQASERRNAVLPGGAYSLPGRSRNRCCLAEVCRIVTFRTEGTSVFAAVRARLSPPSSSSLFKRSSGSSPRCRMSSPAEWNGTVHVGHQRPHVEWCRMR